MTDESERLTLSSDLRINSLFTELLALCEEGARMNARIERLRKRMSRNNARIDQICSLMKTQKWSSAQPKFKGRDAAVLGALQARLDESLSPTDVFQALHPNEEIDTQGGEYTRIVHSLSKLIDEGVVEKVSRGRYRAIAPPSDPVSS